MESMPSAGYRGGDAGGSDGYGGQLYAQHHNPFVYFPDLAGDLPTHDKPLTTMLGDLNGPQPPAFVWVTPNMLDDMHDGPLSTGDTWLSQEIPQIQATSWYRAGGVIVVTWDEGQDADTSGIAGGSGGHIVGIVISQALYGAKPDTAPVDDAGILRSNGAADPAHGSVPGL
jgi:acid phosphatase